MTVTSTNPTYHDAVEKLNSTQSGFKVLEERRRLGQKLTADHVEQMRQWVRRIGHNIDDLNRLNFVHVAGTKGKGTTCAFVNSILQQYQKSSGAPHKIGLYTSPHLVVVRERIRINSQPISEEKFTKYFFEVWDALESSAINEGVDPAEKPTYFRFLTLLAFHVFMREGVDAAIFEVGVGGEHDSTNIMTQPAVTGITTLGIDHVAALGDTIDKIAWHKAGIFKNECPAFTVSQVPEAMEVLEQRAKERNVNLTQIKVYPALFNIGLKPAEHFQRENASLAIKLSTVILEKFGLQVDPTSDTLPDEMRHGLENIVWRGRCEILIKNNQSWHLDGAHTEESLKIACSWYGRLSQSQSAPRILIFNQQSLRDSAKLLRTLYHEMYSVHNLDFQYAIFCPSVTYEGATYKVDFANRNTDPKLLQTLSLQRELADVWRELDPRTEVSVLGSIEGATKQVEKITSLLPETSILVTGSFHLVGGALSVLEGESFALEKATTV